MSLNMGFGIEVELSGRDVVFPLSADGLQIVLGHLVANAEGAGAEIIGTSLGAGGRGWNFGYEPAGVDLRYETACVASVRRPAANALRDGWSGDAVARAAGAEGVGRWPALVLSCWVKACVVL